MAYYGSRRRYRRDRGRPQTGIRSVRFATRREIPTYTRPQAYCKKLIHLHPVESPSFIAIEAEPLGSMTSRHHLNAVPQGDGLGNRHANKMLCRMLYINGLITTAQSPLISANEIRPARLVVLWDREARGLAPVFADVYDTPNVTSFPRVQFRERFQILYEKTFNPSADVGWFNTAGQAAYLTYNRMLKLRIPVNRMTVWTPGATTGSIANVEKGSLYLLFITPAAPGNDSLVFNYEYKLTFEDIE